MLAIPQSTALQVVFKAFLASDHTTEATGKTIAITISKNGGAFGNPAAGATNATEISSGWYTVPLGTGDTGTIGPLALRGAVALIDDVGMWYQVVKATNGGMTALPDTAVTTNASLITTGTGTAQLSTTSGQVLLQTGSGTGQLDFTSGVVKANVTQAAGTAWGSGAITSGVFAANSITATAIDTTADNQIADAILDRDMSTGADSGSTTVRTMRQALRFLRNKWAISGSTLTVYKEDDSTSSWSSTVTSTAGADPVTANDPAGP